MIQSFSGSPINNNMTSEQIPPKGWFVATDDHDKIVESTSTSNNGVGNSNLPLAAEKATQFIDELQSKFNIKVPEAYLRVEQGSIFHTLLFIHQKDYLSPEILAARIFAKKFSGNETRFDLKFSFCNLDENNRKSEIIESGYRLKHVEYDDRPPSPAID